MKRLKLAVDKAALNEQAGTTSPSVLPVVNRRRIPSLCPAHTAPDCSLVDNGLPRRSRRATRLDHQQSA
jgi:hypothetical protein